MSNSFVISVLFRKVFVCTLKTPPREVVQDPLSLPVPSLLVGRVLWRGCWETEGCLGGEVKHGVHATPHHHAAIAQLYQGGRVRLGLQS